MWASTTAYSTSLCAANRAASSTDVMLVLRISCDRSPSTRPSLSGTPSRTASACACCGLIACEPEPEPVADSACIRLESALNLTMTRASSSAGAGAGAVACACRPTGPRSMAPAGHEAQANRTSPKDQTPTRCCEILMCDSSECLQKPTPNVGATRRRPPPGSIGLPSLQVYRSRTSRGADGPLVDVSSTNRL